MRMTADVSRRSFLELLGATAATPVFAGVATPSTDRIVGLRREIVESPVAVALHRARVFTSVFQQNEGEPWMVRKSLAVREYLRTVPLYIRPGDRIAGSISETPGAMPVMAEIGIAENNIYTGENPRRAGYLRGQVPDDIRAYWMNRSLWGQARTQILGQPPFRDVKDVPPATQYKFISNQGHLSPAYSDLLRTGLGGALRRVRERTRGRERCGEERFPAGLGGKPAGRLRVGGTLLPAFVAGGQSRTRPHHSPGRDRTARYVPGGAATDLVRPSGNSYRRARVLLHARSHRPDPLPVLCRGQDGRPNYRPRGSRVVRELRAEDVRQHLLGSGASPDAGIVRGRFHRIRRRPYQPAVLAVPGRRHQPGAARTADLDALASEDRPGVFRLLPSPASRAARASR